MAGMAETRAMQALLRAQPGARGEPVPVPAGHKSPAVVYKVMGKIFAILSVRGEQSVILKCDPHLGAMLREQYEGIAEQSHLDNLNWISVALDADIPPSELERLVAHSYALVRAGLTPKEKARLAALGD
jgi:predicted DNA-binding protein (MmcQ/YjbR family)